MPRGNFLTSPFRSVHLSTPTTRNGSDPNPRGSCHQVDTRSAFPRYKGGNLPTSPRLVDSDTMTLDTLVRFISVRTIGSYWSPSRTVSTPLPACSPICTRPCASLYAPATSRSLTSLSIDNIPNRCPTRRTTLRVVMWHHCDVHYPALPSWGPASPRTP